MRRKQLTLDPQVRENELPISNARRTFAVAPGYAVARKVGMTFDIVVKHCKGQIPVGAEPRRQRRAKELEAKRQRTHTPTFPTRRCSARTTLFPLP